MDLRTELAALETPWYVPDGAASPSGKRLYLAVPGGGVEAVDVATGEPAWRTDVVGPPLLGLPSGVLAADLGTPGEVRMVVLAAEDGRVAFRTEAAPRPAGAEWRVSSVEADGDGVTVGWATTASAPGGRQLLPPQPEPERNGVLRLDADGTLREAEAPPRAPEAWPEGAAELGIIPDASRTRWIWRSGERRIALARTPGRGRRTRLLLHAWDLESDHQRRPRELLADVPAEGFLELHWTPDVRHLFLLRCNDEPEEGTPPGGICEWLVFSVATGELLLALPHEAGITPDMGVVNDVLLLVHSGTIPSKRELALRTLRAVELGSGAIRWSRPLPGQPVTVQG